MRTRPLLATLAAAGLLCACEREPAPPPVAAADPNAMYAVTLPAGFTQSFDGDAPTDYGELRLGELLIVENRTGDRLTASFRRDTPRSSFDDGITSYGQEIPIPSKGRISGPALDRIGIRNISAHLNAVVDLNWTRSASWESDPWGRRIVVSADESGEIEMTTSLFIPPEEHQMPFSAPSDWDYDADAGSPDTFRLIINERAVIENALGHRIKAVIELEYGVEESTTVITVLPSKGVTKWDAPSTPHWMKVTFLQVPLLNDPAASTPTRGFESRVSDQGLTVRFARDADGEVTTDFHQGIDR